MDFKICCIFITILLGSITAEVQAPDISELEKEFPSLIGVKPQYFDLSTKGLNKLWHTASVRGLIKAKSKDTFSKVSLTERIVYQQCEQDAKTVVALAKCAVQLFNARDYAQEQARLRELELKRSQPILTVTLQKSMHPVFRTSEQIVPVNKYYQGYGNRMISQELAEKLEQATSYKTSDVYQTKERENVDLNISGKDSIYYSPKYGYVRNPIRSQRRRKLRIRRQKDEIADAYQLFLKEERRKKKLEAMAQRSRVQEDGREQEEVIQREVPEMNVMGLPRRMILPGKKREKRMVTEPEPLSSNGFRPNINFPKIAAKYFARLVEGKESTGRNSLELLKKVKQHFERTEKCNKYLKSMNEQNKEVFSRLALPIDSRQPQVEASPTSILDDMVKMINSFAASESASKIPSVTSVLSPRLFSLFPSKAAPGKILSPTILSFQEDGFFSIPDLFEMVTTEKKYQQIMLEAIMDLSGASAALEEVHARLSDEIQNMETIQYPLVQKLKGLDRDWSLAKNMFDDVQHKDYTSKGYAFMREEQLQLLYGAERYHSTGVNLTAVAAMSNEERERRIENDIRALAQIGRQKWPMWNERGSAHRWKRDEGNLLHDNPNDPPEETEGGETHHERINGVDFETLRPHAFTHVIGEGIVLEAVTLSPVAFIAEIMAPEALGMYTLSPRAFIASVLSPGALIARVLSPTAFRAEVLSPRALHTWILSPEAMITEVLSPRVLDPRVLSPKTMLIDVLSPGVLAPHVLSSESLGVVILSPNILSPRIASEEKMLVEILSPHILGGPHSKEEESHEILEVGGHRDHETAREEGRNNEGHGEGQHHGGGHRESG